MKMVVSYLDFVFFIEVKAKSKYRILNFVFQFIKKTKWHFGYTDSIQYNNIGSDGYDCLPCDRAIVIFEASSLGKSSFNNHY